MKGSRICHPKIIILNCRQLRADKRKALHSLRVYLKVGKSHRQRSLVGCSPWGLEDSDTTEQLHFHFSLSWTGEGNGNPLQCSCLENPRDWDAWWAAVYGVAQSRTWLKWHSSSRTKVQKGVPLPLSTRKDWSSSLEIPLDPYQLRDGTRGIYLTNFTNKTLSFIGSHSVFAFPQFACIEI